MVRSKLIIVSDDQDVVQRAKAFAASNGVSCEVHSVMEWDKKSKPMTLGGMTTEDKGAKILPFPGTAQFAGGRKVQTINEMESQAIEKAIGEYNGNLTEAAKALGIGRATLYRKVKLYGLNPSMARRKRAA